MNVPGGGEVSAGGLRGGLVPGPLHCVWNRGRERQEGHSGHCGYRLRCGHLLWKMGICWRDLKPVVGFFVFLFFLIGRKFIQDKISHSKACNSLAFNTLAINIFMAPKGDLLVPVKQPLPTPWCSLVRSLSLWIIYFDMIVESHSGCWMGSGGRCGNQDTREVLAVTEGGGNGERWQVRIWIQDPV